MAIVVAVNTSEKKMSKHIKYMIRAQCCQPVCEIVFNFIQFPQLLPPSFPLFSMFFPSFWDDERKLHDIAFLGIRFKDFLLLFCVLCSMYVVCNTYSFVYIRIRPHTSRINYLSIPQFSTLFPFCLQHLKIHGMLEQLQQ